MVLEHVEEERAPRSERIRPRVNAGMVVALMAMNLREESKDPRRVNDQLHLWPRVVTHEVTEMVALTIGLTPVLRTMPVVRTREKGNLATRNPSDTITSNWEGMPPDSVLASPWTSHQPPPQWRRALNPDLAANVRPCPRSPECLIHRLPSLMARH